MFGRIAMTAALLAASIIPTAMAEKCYAIGVRTTNSAGFGLGGTTYTGGEALVLYNEAGDQIGNYDPGNFGSGICSDFISVPTDKLDLVFEWGATCETNKWRYGRNYNAKCDRMLTHCDIQRVPWRLRRPNPH